MAVLIARLGENKYVKWSNTTDSPVSNVMSKDDLIEDLESAEQLTFEEAMQLVQIANVAGTSDPNLGLESLVATNRAGPSEEWLSLDEIILHYQG